MGRHALTLVDEWEAHMPEDAKARPLRARIEKFIREWVQARDAGVSVVHDPAQPLRLQSLDGADLSMLIEAKLGVHAPLEHVLAGLTIGELAACLDGLTDGGATTGPSPQVVSSPQDRHEPFALTDIQQAYVFGRSSTFGLGGISTHVYYEFEAEALDVGRLESAWNKVIARHEMLRAVLSDNARQRVLASIKTYQISVNDFRGYSASETARRLAEIREELSHEVLPADRWPLFTIRVSRLDARRTRIHLSIDLLFADAHSIALAVREWAMFYADPELALPSPTLTFRDYLLAHRQLSTSAQYARARDYWLDRLPSLPSAPDLPMNHRAVTCGSPRFSRRELWVDADSWTALRERAREANVTPSALLATVYAEVLARWSGQAPHFTVNVTLGDRVPLHPEVGDVVGDFTSSVLLEVDLRGARSFHERARRVHRQLVKDLDHRSFSGVAVLRERARRDGEMPLMPVVFTSLLETSGDDVFRGPFSDPGFAVSQTPQVCLDHQVSTRDGALQLVWDCLEDRFPPGMLDAMVATTRTRLAELARRTEHRESGTVLPEEELAARLAVNDTAAPLAVDRLHEGIDRWATERPDAIAVVAGDRKLTYRELDERANQVANRLRELGARPNTLVAIVMEKGWQQVVAALAVVRAGAAYLPIDADLPARRISELLALGEVELALTQAGRSAGIEWPQVVTALAVDDESAFAGTESAPLDHVAKPDDLAYVIFTSGSTGRPKGVKIQHHAAANTIADCLERFGLREDDRVLALSSLSFDLSVFDVFATLRAGAVLVIPEPAAMRNPGRWAELVREHGITVWNSVPALFDMLVEFANGTQDAIGDSLRLAMLSGDWLPVDLPDRARRILPRLDMVSMGGATEASIWSVLYRIGAVEPDWPSIPYGRPMLNQTMHVLDDALEPRPIWVPGELYIGGAGLAAGYWREPVKTAARFIEHPKTGERLYRTGDLARYLPDGNLEFLGREDNQVKIRGYRVELGEIESALLEHPALRSAVVIAAGEPKGAKRLVAYCVTDGSDLGSCDLRRHLGARLPEYMVPQTYLQLTALPLSDNGKVDRGALPDPTFDAPGSMSCAVAPPTDVADRVSTSDPEWILRAVWQEVLGIEEIDRHLDFFEIGGDSLLAMRVIAKAGAAGLRLDPDEFFAHPTIAEAAASAVDSSGQVALPPTEHESVTGEVPMTPSQHWFFDEEFAGQDHWNGFWPLLSVPKRLDPTLLGAALHRVIVHHDALRTRFVRGPGADGQWHAVISGPEAAAPVPFRAVDLSRYAEREQLATVERICAESQARLSLEDGPVLRLTYFDFGDSQPGRLHLAAHWAVVDYYSSRVLFEDLWRVYDALLDGRPVELPPKTTSVAEYARRLHEHVEAGGLRDEVGYWTDPERFDGVGLPIDHDEGPDDQASARQLMVLMDDDVTSALLNELPREAGCEQADPLLSAITRAVSAWTKNDGLIVEIETHGRLTRIEGVDLSRTVGRCSSFVPVFLRASASDSPRESLLSIAKQMRGVPNRGSGHGMLRYLSDDTTTRQALAQMPAPALNFNFWGRMNEYLDEAILPIQESPGALQSAQGHRPRMLDVFGMVVGDQLALVFLYSSNRHRGETITALAEETGRQLLALVGVDDNPDDPLPPYTVVPFDESAFVRAEVR